MVDSELPGPHTGLPSNEDTIDFGRRFSGPDRAPRYQNSIADAVADLGRPEKIGKVFSGFQRYLYDAPQLQGG